MKIFTFKASTKGTISNRLYIKLRILKGSGIDISFSTEAFNIKGDRWVVPDYCHNKGYQG
jgi:hypothetical protein